ncbi:MAG TPA: NAD-dependent epimerase/dehydratase family protein [Pyrinomonadaceae bacterium]|nr:NAD-dependent epimerase/dehydratase family protein [Pyrinomonadaceae bacterium]
MKLLILGGTGFLGRYVAEAARAAQHEVSVFSRGRRDDALPGEFEKLRGDREGDLGALAGRKWDSVIDASGFLPRHVSATAELLADAVDHYIFISSIAVYEDFGGKGIDETAPLAWLPEGVETVTRETYGALKAKCEKAAERAMPGRVLNVRPGIMVGPHDPSDRFTYWVQRIARGGEVLAPDTPERAVQFIDVRDLAGWLVRMAESGAVGTYNAVGPSEVLTMGQFLEECRRVSGSDATFTWVGEEVLVKNRVVTIFEMPFWERRRKAGFFAIDSRKAFAAGLDLRPLTTTIQDTLEWCAARPPETPWAAGLSEARERDLLRQAVAASAPVLT